jgi:hypothetical protein
MIQEITVKKTENYLKLKEIALGGIPWYYHNSTSPPQFGIDFPFFGHVIVAPPGIPNNFSTYCSDHHILSGLVLSEIFEQNNIDVNCVFRIALNMTLPLSSDAQTSFPHYDHDFPHKNLLVYLTDSDGDTVNCEKDELRYTPKEDTGIVFEGKHYHHLPTYGRRVVLVSTFM